ARGRGARSRRLPAGLLRQARPHLPNLRAVDGVRRAPSRHQAGPAVNPRGDVMIVSSLRATSPARLLGAMVLVLALSGGAAAKQSYKSPEEAAEAPVSAARSGDGSAILSVLGAGGADIVRSGDRVADAATRERFLAAYDAKHQIETEENKATLVVGKDD